MPLILIPSGGDGGGEGGDDGVGRKGGNGGNSGGEGGDGGEGGKIVHHSKSVAERNELVHWYRCTRSELRFNF